MKNNKLSNKELMTLAEKLVVECSQEERQQIYENVKIDESNIKIYEKILKINKSRLVFNAVCIIGIIAIISGFGLIYSPFILGSFSFPTIIGGFLTSITGLVIGMSSSSINDAICEYRLKKIKQENPDVYVNSVPAPTINIAFAYKIREYYKGKSTDEKTNINTLEQNEHEIKTDGDMDLKKEDNPTINLRNSLQDMTLSQKIEFLEKEKEFWINFSKQEENITKIEDGQKSDYNMK